MRSPTDRTAAVPFQLLDRSVYVQQGVFVAVQLRPAERRLAFLRDVIR